MAEHEDTGSEANSEHTYDSAAPVPKPAALHREPPLIEGQAMEDPAAPGLNTAGHDTHATDAASAATKETESTASKSEDLADEPAAEPANNSAPSEPDVPPHVASPLVVSDPSSPKRGLSLVSILIAAIIGALAGFAGAYAAHMVLDSGKLETASLDERLSALNSKLAADEKRIDAAANGSRDAVSALEKRLGAVETSAKQALGLATTAQTRMAQIETAKPGAPDQSATSPVTVVAPPAPAADLAPLRSRVNTLEQRLAQLETAFNTPKTAERATQEPESKPDPQDANAPAIAIVAENLVHKVASGAPYASDIAALEKLGFDTAKLLLLRPSAAAGIATNQALSDEFNKLTPGLLASEKPATPPQDSFMSRLIDHASGLVRVRKTGDPSGDDLSARIARLKDALTHDDTDAALKEWAGFPDTAKTASAHWAEAAKARVAALAGANAIASDAMANLTKVKS